MAKKEKAPFNWDDYSDASPKKEAEEKPAFNWDEYASSEKKEDDSTMKDIITTLPQALTFGLSDELSGGVKAGVDVLSGKAPISDIVERYKRHRDVSRAELEGAKQGSPYASLGTEILGAAIPGGVALKGAKFLKETKNLPKIAELLKKFGRVMDPRSTLGITRAGAASAAGGSDAELVDENPELKEFIGDVGVGTVLGAGVGKTLEGGKKLAKLTKEYLQGPEGRALKRISEEKTPISKSEQFREAFEGPVADYAEQMSTMFQNTLRTAQKERSALLESSKDKVVNIAKEVTNAQNELEKLAGPTNLRETREAATSLLKDFSEDIHSMNPAEADRYQRQLSAKASQLFNQNSSSFNPELGNIISDLQKKIREQAVDAAGTEKQKAILSNLYKAEDIVDLENPQKFIDLFRNFNQDGPTGLAARSKIKAIRNIVQDIDKAGVDVDKTISLDGDVEKNLLSQFNELVQKGSTEQDAIKLLYKNSPSWFRPALDKVKAYVAYGAGKIVKGRELPSLPKMKGGITATTSAIARLQSDKKDQQDNNLRNRISDLKVTSQDPNLIDKLNEINELPEENKAKEIYNLQQDPVYRKAYLEALKRLGE